MTQTTSGVTPGHVAVFADVKGNIQDGGAPPDAASGTVTSVSVVSANGVSGTVANPTTTPAITLAVQTGTSSQLGLLQPDGVTITASNGIISAPATGGTVLSVAVETANGISGTVADSTTTPQITLSLGAITPSTVNGLTLAAESTGFEISGGTTSKTLTVPNTASVSGTNTGDNVAATTSTLGLVSTDGATLTNTSGAIAVATATSSQLGAVKPDGTIITVSSGVITVPKASSSTFGVVEVDNTTITASSGVISRAALTGGVTTSGNAATVVTNANLTGDATSVGNATSVVNVLAIPKTMNAIGNSGTSKAVNWALGDFQTITISGAVALTFSNPPQATKGLTLLVTQDSTGHVYSLPTVIWPGGTVPSLSTAANKKDALVFDWDGTNYWGEGAIAFA